MDYKGARWLNLRARALARDHFECQWCAAEGKAVPATTVHHILPAEQFPDKAYELDNLVSLCRESHEAHHGRDHAWKPRRRKTTMMRERFPEWW